MFVISSVPYRAGQCLPEQLAKQALTYGDRLGVGSRSSLGEHPTQFQLFYNGPDGDPTTVLVTAHINKVIDSTWMGGSPLAQPWFESFWDNSALSEDPKNSSEL